MTVLKRLSLILLFITSFILLSLSLSSCGDSYEDGILYNGNTVVGADKSAKTLSVKEGTASIAAGAFADCKELTSLTLPDSITEITAGAFNGCNALIKSEGGVLYVDSWVIGAESDATEITIKDGTRGIAREAFMGMTSIKNALIPDSVMHIGARAFFRCSSLESITLPFVGKSAATKNSMHFGYIFGAFNKEQNSDYVPQSLVEVNVTNSDEIADYAFSECNKIKKITLPSALTAIGEGAFYECTALSEITIPDSVAGIGEKAFYKCSALTSAKLPENDGFTALKEYTFAYCSGIVELIIPASVTEIGACAVARCTNLEALTIQNPCLERIGQQAFDGCTYLSSVELTVKSLGKAAFQNCTALTNVTIGEGTLEIESYAFNGCSAISSFSMPKSVAKIGEYAFYACHSLTSVDLGENVTSIERSTFQNCINLTGTVISPFIKQVGNNAFSGCNKLVERRNGMSFVNGWVTDIQSSVTSLEITDEVLGFADGAFSDALNLAEIVFSGSEDAWLKIKGMIPSSVLSEINVVINANKS